MTVLEVIQRSSDFLSKKGVESPRLQVELLLAHLLQMPRMKLYLNFERVLTETELEKLRGFVQRRGLREPLQHIVGSANFCGLEFLVNGHVLVPRPETELLAERGWKFLALRASEKTAPPVALDFGTGSGCLAVMLAKNCSCAETHALDVSAEAIEVARGNAARHEVADRIQFHHGNGFAALEKNLRFDLIISNPPYISREEIPTLEPEVRDHDPALALDGGMDGLDFYRVLAKESQQRLVSDGQIMMEFGDGQAESIRKIFEEQMWVVEAVERDYSQRERFLIAKQK